MVCFGGGGLKIFTSEKGDWALKSNLFPVREGALKIFLNRRSKGVLTIF